MARHATTKNDEEDWLPLPSEAVFVPAPNGLTVEPHPPLKARRCTLLIYWGTRWGRQR
jgi:hypothetical protein